MRRDYFTLESEHVADDADDRPTVRVGFDGPSDAFEQRLTAETDVDVAFRLQTDLDEPDAHGVFGVTDRLTGEFVLEVNAEADRITELIDAAREFGQASNDAEDCYRVVIEDRNGRRFETTKRVLLVYDRDGSLLRQHSLIPSGVEI
ncbi:MAG: DUF5793 family protein [Haloarculaceae archaeon]